MNDAASAPARRGPAAQWPSYFAAALVAIAVHAMWWFGRANAWHPDLRPRPSLQPPRLSYVGLPVDDPSTVRSPIRELWSPVLFALPTPAGFSPPGTRRDTHLRPSLRPRTGEGVLLAQSGMGAGAALPQFTRSLEDTVAGTSNRLVAGADEPVFSTSGQTTGFVLRVQWLDDEPDLKGNLAARDLGPWLDDHAWEARAFVNFDAQGTVRSVLLETATALPERNDAIVRALRKLRAAPAGVPVYARVLLQYEQSGLPAPPAIGGTVEGGAAR